MQSASDHLTTCISSLIFQINHGDCAKHCTSLLSSPHRGPGDRKVELHTKIREDLIIKEEVPTRAFMFKTLCLMGRNPVSR